MALAIHFERLIREGEVTDQAEIARLGNVSRARVTQIMNLLHLVPDIQEEILFLPRTMNGRDAVREHMVRPIAAVLDWRKQRRMWGGDRTGLLTSITSASNGQAVHSTLSRMLSGTWTAIIHSLLTLAGWAAQALLPQIGVNH